VPVFIDRFKGGRTIAGLVLIAGVLLAIAVAVRSATRAAERVRAANAQHGLAPAAHDPQASEATAAS